MNLVENYLSIKILDFPYFFIYFIDYKKNIKQL